MPLRITKLFKKGKKPLKRQKKITVHKFGKSDLQNPEKWYLQKA